MANGTSLDSGSASVHLGLTIGLPTTAAVLACLGLGYCCIRKRCVRSAPVAPHRLHRMPPMQEESQTSKQFTETRVNALAYAIAPAGVKSSLSHLHPDAESSVDSQGP